MLKGILAFIIFIFVLLILIVMLTGSYVVRTFRKMKKTAEQMAEQQARQHREETARQRQQYSHRTQYSQQSQQSQRTYTTQEAYDEQPRRTQTASGETIIDHRHQERENKKIFDDSDGEYVEFTEE